MYGSTNLLNYFYILVTSLQTQCRIISFSKYKNVKIKIKYFVDVDGLFMFVKWWEFITKKSVNH
jgi:hypothetical protein